MPQLIMHGPVYQNGYNPSEMFASISYGGLKKPCDHEGKEITESSPSFDSYLINNVIPYLQRALEKSAFILTAKIDYPYNSSIPAFILKKNDGTEAAEDDMTELTALLSKAIKSLNADCNKIGQSARLFDHPASSSAASAAAAARMHGARKGH